MPRLLVQGRLKPARKAELAARLKDGTLAQGAPYQEALLSALHAGHAAGDDAYFILDAGDADLSDERAAIEGYLDVVDATPVDEVPEREIDALNTYAPLPEWAGVD